MLELTSDPTMRCLHRAEGGKREERRDENIDGVVNVLPKTNTQPEHERVAWTQMVREMSAMRSPRAASDYGAGWTTVLPAMVTAVCANSLPLIDAPVSSATDV